MERVDVVPSTKKKRKHQDDDIEGMYLQRLAREDESNRKRAKVEGENVADLDQDRKSGESEAESTSGSHGEQAEDEPFEVPKHESLLQSKDEIEVEKASRTVFLGNVSSDAIKSNTSRRKLLDHLGSFLSELPDHKPRHKVESLRFRSTAYAGSSVPKKAAFAKKELMDATTKSSNAYAVYSTALAAREAVKRLNGTTVLDRHLRVDGVAHPAKTDHRRCVFVGNLGFVDDESLIRAAEEKEGGEGKPKKAKPPGDVEEGLWRQFEKAGAVESVRVVRDKTTRVGKGFAYVQFKVGTISNSVLLLLILTLYPTERKLGREGAPL